MVPFLRMVLGRGRIKIVNVPWVLAAIWSSGALAAENQSGDFEWRDYGGSHDSSKYVPLRQITKENVRDLGVAWTYPTGDEAAYQFSPIVARGVMYVYAKNGSLVALDARTGKELWIHANLQGISRRGVNYWENADGSERRLLFSINSYLQAIDAKTGQSIPTFGRGGVVDLREGLGRDPTTIGRIQSSGPGRVFENLILLGSTTGEGYVSPPGHLRAYNVITGELAWIFHTIPQPGEYGYETWPRKAHAYAGGVNTWGEISIDARRGIAYFPVGSPTYDYYGADRHGSNLYGSSILALDARTGRRLWHFQLVHHDLWDYDPTAAPQLITLRHGDRVIDAVAQAGKQGFLFVFDRVTGEPVWPIEERPVPGSDVPGEKAWPTQPFPTVLPPFSRQTLTVDDLTPLFLSDEERSHWTARISQARTGLYTPPSAEAEVISVPGAVGGANWGNTASDPERGLVFVLNQDFPSFYRLKKHEPAPAQPSEAVKLRAEELYAQNCLACHGPNGVGASGPPLLGVGRKLSFDIFAHVVASGREQMPAFAHIDEESLQGLYRHFGGEQGTAGVGRSTEVKMPEGPVVASGGVPVTQNRPPAARRGWASTPYPEGTDAPTVRYTTDYGLGHPYIMRPPWSYVVAYDLNRGTLRWKVPLGQDRDASAAGASNTGVPRGAQRNGMIVTATGLLFSTAKDGRIYAFDTDTGSELWSAALPTGTEGLPIMYEIDGRQYLAVTAATPLTWGRKSRESGIGAEPPHLPGAYVVFALKNKSKN